MTEPHDRSTCLELAERLSEYLDGELPPELVARVEEHFEGCARCETFLTSLRRVKGLGAVLPEVTISPPSMERLREEVRRRLQDPS